MIVPLYASGWLRRRTADSQPPPIISEKPAEKQNFRAIKAEAVLAAAPERAKPL